MARGVSARELNPTATILKADSVVRLDRPDVFCMEIATRGGPRVTHGLVADEI